MRLLMRYANINEARKHLAGKVIVWYKHQLGGQLRDRWMWMAEKDGEVIDYQVKRSSFCGCIVMAQCPPNK